MTNFLYDTHQKRIMVVVFKKANIQFKMINTSIMDSLQAHPIEGIECWGHSFLLIVAMISCNSGVFLTTFKSVLYPFQTGLLSEYVYYRQRGSLVRTFICSKSSQSDRLPHAPFLKSDDGRAYSVLSGI